MQFAPLQVSCHRDTPCMWHDSSICVDLHAIALRCYGTCLWLMQMRRHHGLQPARILLSGFAFIMMCHLPPQPMILSSGSLSSPLTVHGTEGFVGLPFLVYSIVMLLRRGKFSAYVFPADVKKQGASCPFLLRPPPRNGNVISAHAASPPKRGLPHMQPERTDTKELKGTMPQGPPATRVASITMPEPDSWRTSMIVLIAWPLCKPASHPLVGKRLHSWMQKTSTMSRAGGEQKPLLHRSASQDPFCPNMTRQKHASSGCTGMCAQHSRAPHLKSCKATWPRLHQPHNRKSDCLRTICLLSLCRRHPDQIVGVVPLTRSDWPVKLHGSTSSGTFLYIFSVDTDASTIYMPS